MSFADDIARAMPADTKAALLDQEVRHRQWVIETLTAASGHELPEQALRVAHDIADGFGPSTVRVLAEFVRAITRSEQAVDIDPPSRWRPTYHGLANE